MVQTKNRKSFYTDLYPELIFFKGPIWLPLPAKQCHPLAFGSLPSTFKKFVYKSRDKAPTVLSVPQMELS